jgi:hypothetical protein
VVRPLFPPQHRFLQHLAQRPPASAEPIIVADSSFKVPFFREIERLGWRWIGRVRGRDYIKLTWCWRSCKRLFEEATTTPNCLGGGHCVLVRRPKQGRQAKTAAGKRARFKKSQQAARSARKPWLLVGFPRTL